MGSVGGLADIFGEGVERLSLGAWLGEEVAGELEELGGVD